MNVHTPDGEVKVETVFTPLNMRTKVLVSQEVVDLVRTCIATSLSLDVNTSIKKAELEAYLYEQVD